MFAERKDAVEMALGIALLIWCAKMHTRTWRVWPRVKTVRAAIRGELGLLVLTFVAVLLIFLGTW